MTPRSRRVTVAIMCLALAGLCAAVLSLAGIYLYLDPQVPKAETYRQVKLETPLRVYTADKKLIAEFGERRLIPISLDEVPEYFIRGLLDTEDKRFYEHQGIDYISLTNDTFGLIGDLVTGEGLGSGASTITMQLARNISFSLERKFLRKFKEMLLALKIERELSKDEILELYINVVPFGKRAYGAQAGALTYYGKLLKDLNLAQLAMLVGIPNAPEAGNPVNGPARALRRRNVVLRRMLDQGSIDADSYHAAVASPITAQVFDRALDVPAPYPSEWVRQQLLGKFPDLYSGGYEVVTTLDSARQRAASEALRKGLMGYDRRHGYRGPETNVADLIITAQGIDENQVTDQLAQRQARAGLLPGVVVAVDDLTASVRLQNARSAELDLGAVRWARTFIDVDTRGAGIRSVADVLKVGDVIRVQDLGLLPQETVANETETATAEDSQEVLKQTWRLAQLPEIQGALVSLDPQNGAVQAMVGGFDFSRNQYNHALQAARQPGSGFKPFVYSAALASGITPASIFMDAPLVFADRNLESDYRPDNDNNKYNGPTRLREALYRSINLVSMRVLLKVGAGNVLDHVAHFGFNTSTFPRNTQLAIGGGTMAVTPIDMATAYAVLANGGYLIEPNIIREVRDIDGNLVFQPTYPVVCDETCQNEVERTDLLTGEPANLEELFASNTPTEELSEPADTAKPALLAAPRVIDERNAYIMHSMLQDVIRRGTGRRARSLERSDLAGKTGTTNDAADTWFNGYNPDLVATVWVGFPNYQALGRNEYGSTTPLPIWIDYMTTALAGVRESSPDQPNGVVTMKIDPKTGALAGIRETDAIFEFFLAEHTPRQQPSVEPNPDQNEAPIKAVDIF
jgi:penicillin-binding protein 1A